MAKRAPLNLNAKRTKKQPATSEEAKPTTAREGLKLVGAHVPMEAARKFARIAADLNRTKQDLLLEALEDFFAKYKAHT